MQLDHSMYGGFPLVIRPAAGHTCADDLSAWLELEREHVTELLTVHGALLFRGFGIETNQFEAICKAGTPGLQSYTGGGSPRSHIGGKVYTSTEYAATQAIPLHCECTYFREPPEFLWFFCDTPPVSEGETPIGDMQNLLSQLDPAVVERFHTRGVSYIYNLHDGDGFGRGWREAFNTQERDVVDSWLINYGAEYAWREDNTLHVKLSAPGLRTHSRTGETVWGNQAVNWHIAHLQPRITASMRKLYWREELIPKHAMFGDDTPIADDEVRYILEVMTGEERAFPWQQSDILLCDNQRIAHGRRPFQGDRRILVAMA